MNLRRHRLAGLARSLALGLALTPLLAAAQAPAKLKLGLMLPYTGTYAALGTAIENGLRLYLDEQGGRLGGREVEFFKVDDESDPAKATDNVNKLIKRDNVDVLVGTVHSGVALAMARAARDSGTLLVVPNAGADAITGTLCAQNIFRSSFSNWQPAYAAGLLAARDGKKKAVTITWKYAAGDESAAGFKEAFEKDGGQILGIGLRAVKGDVSRKAEFAAAVENATIDSPRGPFKLSFAHNPVQDFYLRRVEGRENRKVGLAVRALADPARGCRL